MKIFKVFISTAVMALSVISSPVLATQTVNYAIFSSKDAILGSNTAKSRFNILHQSKAFLIKKTRFEDLNQRGQSLIDKVTKDADVLSAAKKTEIKNNLDGKQKELGELAEEIKKMEVEVGRNLILEMSPRLERAVTEVVKAKNIDLLLEKQVVVYANADLDITQDIIDRLNE